MRERINVAGDFANEAVVIIILNRYLWKISLADYYLI